LIENQRARMSLRFQDLDRTQPKVDVENAWKI